MKRVLAFSLLTLVLFSVSFAVSAGPYFNIEQTLDPVLSGFVVVGYDHLFDSLNFTDTSISVDGYVGERHAFEAIPDTVYFGAGIGLGTDVLWATVDSSVDITPGEDPFKWTTEFLLEYTPDDAWDLWARVRSFIDYWKVGDFWRSEAMLEPVVGVSAHTGKRLLGSTWGTFGSPSSLVRRPVGGVT